MDPVNFLVSGGLVDRIRSLESIYRTSDIRVGTDEYRVLAACIREVTYTLHFPVGIQYKDYEYSFVCYNYRGSNVAQDTTWSQSPHSPPTFLTLTFSPTDPK